LGLLNVLFVAVAITYQRIGSGVYASITFKIPGAINVHFYGALH